MRPSAKVGRHCEQEQMEKGRLAEAYQSKHMSHGTSTGGRFFNRSLQSMQVMTFFLRTAWNTQTTDSSADWDRLNR
jgi:hypothetical protein